MAVRLSTRIWHAESDNEITVSLALASESPALHVTIDNDGAVQSVNLPRWGNAGEKAFGYIPFGFEAEIISAMPDDRGRPDRPQNEDQMLRDLRSPNRMRAASA